MSLTSLTVSLRRFAVVCAQRRMSHGTYVSFEA